MAEPLVNFDELLLTPTICGLCGHKHRNDRKVCKFPIAGATLLWECPCETYVELSSHS